MEAELLNQAKRAEIEREIAYLRLIAAAERTAGERDAETPARAVKRTFPALRARLLQALRPGS